MCWALQHHVMGVKCENMRNRPKQLFNISPPLEYFLKSSNIGKSICPLCFLQASHEALIQVKPNKSELIFNYSMFGSCTMTTIIKENQTKLVFVDAN